MKHLQKTVFIITFIITSLSSYSQTNPSLIGEWELLKLEIDSTTLIADSAKYHLNITQYELKFNIGYNNCWGDYDLNIENNEINYTPLPCTLKAGDASYGNFYDKILYKGAYELQNSNSLLLITNIRGTYYLKRVN